MSFKMVDKLYVRECGNVVVAVWDPEVLGVLAAPSRKRRSNTMDCIGRARHPLEIAVLLLFIDRVRSVQ